MQHNHDLALLDASNRMVVLGPRKEAYVYDMHPTSYELQPRSFPSTDDVADTVAFFQLAYRLYYGEQLYPAKAEPPAAPPEQQLSDAASP